MFAKSVRNLARPQSWIALAAGLLVAGTASAAPLYQIVDLGTLGGASSFALDVNNNRQVTGNANAAAGPSPNLNGFVWSPPSGPMQGIGVLPGSNNFSRGYAINDAGVVVGESDNNSSKAFRWDAVSGMTGLTNIAGTGVGGVAHDINNSGAIVGISSNGTVSRPTLWNGGTASDLGSIDGTTTSFGRAWGINDQGAAVGVTRTGNGSVSHATMWLNGQTVDLGSFSETAFSEAVAVNGSNVAVGAAVNGSTPSGTSIRRATRWHIESGIAMLEDLGSLGRIHADARDINDAGLIVGYATDISGLPQIAWLWEDGVMTDLNALIDPTLGWLLRSAEGINDDGDIVGYGTINGKTHAFLLIRTEVPEPASLALFGMALSLLVMPRRGARQTQAL